MVNIASQVGPAVTEHQDPRLSNEDLTPTPEAKKTWGTYSLFSLWMSVAHNVGSYTFAAGLFVLGLSAWQVLVSVLVGTLVLYVGCTMSGVIGQRTGVPFPVVSRMSWGVFGANVPALIRGVIAIFWYGIQTYLASVAITVLLLRINPGLEPWTQRQFLGLHHLGWCSFLALWVCQWLIISFGMDMVRRFQEWAGPILWVVMIALAAWLLISAGGAVSFTESVTDISTSQQVLLMCSGAALVVAQLSTLMLNYCDFGRFARSERSVRIGNLLGIPLNWTAFALTSVLVSAGSVAVYGEAISEPALLLARIPNTALLVIGVFMFAFATIGVNIVANFVSPAYDLSNAWPKVISFRMGGAITSILAIVVMPWKLYSSPVVINYFLGTLGAFLGPLFAIMMVDYYLIRKRVVLIGDLYDARPGSAYRYVKGINTAALATFVPTAAISAIIALVPAFADIAPYSWFFGAATAAVGYWMLMSRRINGVVPVSA
ncbi:MAG: NCS1 family nucleobase:cation symporter-1 [Actinomycetota bacterium]